MTESITIRQAKRLAKYFGGESGTAGYVVKAAGVLHACSQSGLAEIQQAYGERFEGIIWSTN